MVRDKKAQLADFVGDLSEDQVNCLARAVEPKTPARRGTRQRNNLS